MSRGFGRPGTVFVVDDEPLMQSALCRAFTNHEWETPGGRDERGGLRRIPVTSLRPGAARHLPGRQSGFDLIAPLRRLSATVQIVIMTASVDAALEAMQRSATSFLTKPVTAESGLAAVLCADELRKPP